VNQEDRVNAPEVTQAWNELRAKDFFGTQYDWLGCFATKHKGIELSVHEDDKAVILLNKYGKLREVSDPDIGSYWVLDEESTSKELAALFENYHLPLVHWTKVQMKEYYLQNGYADIMNQTWFCHHPRKGQPCGTCNPCIYTIEEGLKERFSKSALLRYHVKKFADSVRRS
jgi:7-cyano-7-deazaguanine synthase